MSETIALQHLVSVAEEAFSCTLSEEAPPYPKAEIPQWDSLAHLMLIMAVEEKFGVRLSTDEASSVKSLADIHGIIRKKKSAS